MQLKLIHHDHGYKLETSVKTLGMVTAFIGRSGLIAASSKREGDGATPIGRWPLREIMYRPDRLEKPLTMLKTLPISPDDGWCDDPAAKEYNKRVGLPFDPSHEKLWRDDHAYDVVIPLGYNDSPPVSGFGSAIFFHCLEAGRNHTEGCVAIRRDDMMSLLPHLTSDSIMIIEP